MKPVIVVVRPDYPTTFLHQGVTWTVDPQNFYTPDHGEKETMVEEILEAFEEHIHVLEDSGNSPAIQLEKNLSFMIKPTRLTFLSRENNRGMNRLALAEEYNNKPPCLIARFENLQQILFFFPGGLTCVVPFDSRGTQDDSWYYFPIAR